MNSHQRRKARRYWKYAVEMAAYSMDKDPWAARLWLEQNMGEIGIRWGNMGNSDPWVFFFHAGADANFFSMRWS